jgi:hypothetical protein
MNLYYLIRSGGIFNSFQYLFFRYDLTTDSSPIDKVLREFLKYKAAIKWFKENAPEHIDISPFHGEIYLVKILHYIERAGDVGEIALLETVYTSSEKPVKYFFSQIKDMTRKVKEHELIDNIFYGRISRVR